MKFSETWLREFVGTDLERVSLIESLTMAGLEGMASLTTMIYSVGS